MQLTRDALPALTQQNVGLVVVGIGSVEAGRTFAERTGLPLDGLLVDDTEETIVYRAVGTRNSQRDPVTNKQLFEGVGSMWSGATTDGIKARGRDDLNTVVGNPFRPGPFKPLLPTNMEATMVQGGSFVFEGTRALLEHYDVSSGAHLSLEELLAVALGEESVGQ